MTRILTRGEFGHRHVRTQTQRRDGSRTVGKMAICKPRTEASEETCDLLDFGHLASRFVRTTQSVVY